MTLKNAFIVAVDFLVNESSVHMKDIGKIPIYLLLLDILDVIDNA